MASIQEIMLSGLVFIALFVGATWVFSDVLGTYNQDIQAGYLDGGTDELNATYDLSNSLAKELQESDAARDNLDVSILGGYKALKQMFGMFKLVDKIINAITLTLHIPYIVTWTILIGISLTITIAIIAALLGRQL